MSRSELYTYGTNQSVILNIYDMGSANHVLEGIGLGIYHSGTVVYGSEYSYGGHPFNSTGIFEMEPKSEETLGKDQFKFKQTILIGYTTWTKDNVRQLMDMLGNKRFRGNKYHLFRNNCNHFTSELIRRLCDKEIPNWINRMARISSNIPFLEVVLPIELLSPKITAQMEESDEVGEQHNQSPLNNRIICMKKNYIV